MSRILSNSSFPVLAYPECDDSSPVSPVSLSLVFKYNKKRKQATFCLLSSLFIYACEDAQTFILQYDANNIVSNKTCLGPVTIPLPQERLDELAPEGNAQICTMSLTLKTVCPVWCLPFGPITPRRGYEAPFHLLAKLAQATKLNVVFNYKRLHRDQHESFNGLIEHPEQLSGYPVDQFYREQKYKCVNWLLFNTGDVDAHVETDAATEDEEPPPVYAEANIKGPRDAPTNPTPSPPLKGVLLSPYLGDSPTNEDSASIPSPTFPCSPAASCPGFPPLAASSPQPPFSSNAPTADLQRAVEEAVSTLLPSILPRLLVASSPTPSYSQSIASQISHAPPPPNLSPLGISLYERLAKRIEGELKSIYTHTLSHANYMRSKADLEVEEVLDEGSLELGIEKRNAVGELEKLGDEMRQALREECDDLVEYVTEIAGQEARKRLDEVVHKKQISSEWNQEELRRDKEELYKDRKELRNDKKELRKTKRRLRKNKEKLRKAKEELRKDKKELERDKQKVVSEREDLEREKEALRRLNEV